MYSNRFQRTIASTHGSRGYYIAELILSVLLIAATVVLAFPTYQDFQPHQDLTDDNSAAMETYSNEESGEFPGGGVSVSQLDETVSGHEDQNKDVVAGLESEAH
ncbi:MAG: hypothetical protein ACR2QG_05020 [Gammaproteobacteria bacterium]